MNAIWRKKTGIEWLGCEGITKTIVDPAHINVNISY
jgi:hypothetical protein